MSFEVIVATDTLVSSGSGHTGAIWVSAETGFAPEERWSDFPVVILAWWCGAIAELIDGRNNEVRLDFMDGPFTLWVRHDDGICEIMLERRRATGKEKSLFARATLSDVAETVAAGANNVLHCAEREGWTGADVENLSRALRALRRVLATLARG